MKDYYARLNLPTDASLGEIEAELPTLDDAALRRHARFVLLDPERRAVYDRCHRALRQVAFVRARLGLNSAPFWLLSDSADFSAEPFLRASGRPRRSRLPLLVLLLAVWVAFYLTRRGKSPGPSASQRAATVQEELELPERIVVSEPAADLPDPESGRKWKAWHASFVEETAATRRAWRELTDGLDHETFELAADRCRRLQRRVAACDRDEILPSPDVELDATFQSFLAELDAASQACLQQRFFAMTEHLDQAQAAWDLMERTLRFHGLVP